MKILIANDGMHAHYHERLSWTNALNDIPGVQCAMYDVLKARAFDVFDSFEPDIYIGQLYNIDRPTYKCLMERPFMKVALRTGEYNEGPIDKHILSVTDNELEVLDGLLSKQKPDLVYSHYLQKDIEHTHQRFVQMGIKVLGLPMSADLHTYARATYRPELACNIGFVGGYWPYKGLVIDQYLTPLCYDNKYSIKIFGNQPWRHVNQYCGLLNDSDVADLFKSADICPNLSEPHSQALGIDVNERAFKVLAAGGFCIMDNVRAAKEMFPEGIVFVDSPQEFQEKIDYYIDPANKEEKNHISRLGYEHVLKHHTNYHRVYSLLSALGEDITASSCKRACDDYARCIIRFD